MESWLRHLGFEAKMPAAIQGFPVTESLSAPLNGVAFDVQCLRFVRAAAWRDQDYSSQFAIGAEEDPVDHNLMQFSRRL